MPNILMIGALPNMSILGEAIDTNKLRAKVKLSEKQHYITVISKQNRHDYVMNIEQSAITILIST